MEDLLSFLNSDTRVSSYLAFLATKGFAFTTARKVLFNLRAATATADCPDPKPFSRFLKLALKGYKQLFIPGPPRPIVTVPMFVSCARASLNELLDPTTSAVDAFQLARWRAIYFVAFKGCLRRGEYLGVSLLSPCVEFDQHTLSNLWPLMGLTQTSLPDLWEAVSNALHPKAVVSVTIMSSKCDIFPAHVIISRDPGDPSLCAVVAAAFWLVLMGPTLEVADPFFAFKSGSSTRGPDVSEVVGPLRSFLHRYTSTPPEIISKIALHALRHGGATAAVLGGASHPQTKALGRWNGDSVTVYVTTTLSMQALAASEAISAAFVAPPVPLLRSLSFTFPAGSRLARGPNPLS